MDDDHLTPEEQAEMQAIRARMAARRVEAEADLARVDEIIGRLTALAKVKGEAA